MNIIIGLIVCWLVLTVGAVVLAFHLGFEAGRYDQHVRSKPRTEYRKNIVR